MDLSKQPAITMTLHQLKRLVVSYYDLDHCKTLDDVACRIFELAELCAEGGCKECAATVEALARFKPWPRS